VGSKTGTALWRSLVQHPRNSERQRLGRKKKKSEEGIPIYIRSKGSRVQTDGTSNSTVREKVYQEKPGSSTIQNYGSHGKFGSRGNPLERGSCGDKGHLWEKKTQRGENQYTRNSFWSSFIKGVVQNKEEWGRPFGGGRPQGSQKKKKLGGWNRPELFLENAGRKNGERTKLGEKKHHKLN